MMIENEFYEDDEARDEVLSAFLHASERGVTRNRNAEIGTTVMSHVDHLTSYEPPRLLTPAEVARIFAVDPKTVGRWAVRGLLRSVRTPGGHRRYVAEEVETLARGSFETEAPSRSND